MDYTVPGVTKSWTQLSHFHFTLLATNCYLVMSNFLIYSLPGGIGVGAACECALEYSSVGEAPFHVL